MAQNKLTDDTAELCAILKRLIAIMAEAILVTKVYPLTSFAATWVFLYGGRLAKGATKATGTHTVSMVLGFFKRYLVLFSPAWKEDRLLWIDAV